MKKKQAKEVQKEEVKQTIELITLEWEEKR